MAKITIDDGQLKEVVRRVLREILSEDKGLLRAFISEVAEDLALGELMEKGRSSKKVSRRSVMKILKGEK
jgi:hypothetical protein